MIGRVPALPAKWSWKIRLAARIQYSLSGRGTSTYSGTTRALKAQNQSLRKSIGPADPGSGVGVQTRLDLRIGEQVRGQGLRDHCLALGIGMGRIGEQHHLAVLIDEGVAIVEARLPRQRARPRLAELAHRADRRAAEVDVAQRLAVAAGNHRGEDAVVLHLVAV